MKKEESEGRSSEKGLQAERSYWKWKSKILTTFASKMNSLSTLFP